MREAPLPAVAAVISFIDAINRGDVDRLGDLMTEHHQLHVFDEPSLHGREANIDAWRGYSTAFPLYVIYPEHVVELEGQVAVLGRTTGSHLRLSNSDEMAMRLIWRARVDDGRLACWQLLEDTMEHRVECGLDPDA